MILEDETTGDNEAQEQAAFDAGFEGAAEKPSAKTEPSPAEPPREEPPAPKYVQLTEDQYAVLNGAAAKTVALEQQMSKAFGTIGNLQKVINGLQAQTPRGLKIEIPKDAFSEMERDYPEIAAMQRSALEKALSGITGTAESDPGSVNRVLAEYTARQEVERLKTFEEEYPNWRDIVGAPTVDRPLPDPDVPFRKWLATKDAAYQARVNETNSANVLERAITRFQQETRPSSQPKPKQQPSADTRREQIAAAVQPRGDGAPPTSRNTSEDAFLAGFNSR